jgi:multidrug efflux pump subunit AcrA (membrane-fusion protein)
VSQARDNLTSAQSDLAQAQKVLQNKEAKLADAQAVKKAAAVKVTDLKNQIAALDPTNDAAQITTLNTELGAAQTALDNAKAAVVDAQAAVDKAQAAVNDAQSKVDTAQTLLAQARANATSQVCTGTTEEPAPSPSPSPEPPGGQFQPHTVGVDVIDGEVDALSCSSNNGDLQLIDRQIADREAAGQEVAEPVSRLNSKIVNLNCSTGVVTLQSAAQIAHDCGCGNIITVPGQPAAAPRSVFTDDKNCADFATQADAQAFFESHRSATQPDPDRLDANNNGIACENPADEVVSHTVIPLQDNGSTAVTSGSEITQVPQGSVQTGAE